MFLSTANNLILYSVVALDDIFDPDYATRKVSYKIHITFLCLFTLLFCYYISGNTNEIVNC